MTGATISPRHRRADPVRRVLRADGCPRAGGLCARPGLPAGDVHRAAAVADDPGAGDLQRLQLVHPAGGAVLPAHRQPDERGRHHRPAGAPVARPGRALSRAASRRSTWCCRSSSPASRARRPRTPPARARSSSRRRSRKATTCQLLGGDHRGVGGAGGDHSAVDPDDRLGRHADGVDRRAVPGRHHARAAARRWCRWPPCTSTPSCATTRSTRART